MTWTRRLERTGSSRWPTTSGRPTCATRSPRAPSRRSTSSSTRSASSPGTGARRRLRPGPPRPRARPAGHRGRRRRHLAALRRPGPRGARPRARPSSALDARAPAPSTASSTPRSRSARAPSAWLAGRRRRSTPTAPCSTGMARARAARRAAGASAPSPPTSRCGTSRTPTRSTPPPASTTSAPTVQGRGRATTPSVDLWTTCFTPRELRLLARRGRPRGRARLVGRPRAPTPRAPPDLDHPEFLAGRRQAVAERPPVGDRSRSSPLVRRRRTARPRLVPKERPYPCPTRPRPDDHRRRPADRCGTFDEDGDVHPAADHRRRPRRHVARGRHRRHDGRGRGRPDRRGHGRQGRQGRGPARHRLQVRGRDPGPRAVDPQRRRPARDRVSLGDEIEALVLQKEDKEGRLVLSKKRAQYERAWGDDREDQGRATASSRARSSRSSRAA